MGTKMIVLLCSLVCIGVPMEEKIGISLREQVSVALRGDKLKFSIAVSEPKNHTESELYCCRTGCPRRLQLAPCQITDTGFISSVELFAYNSSISGEYFCQYKSVRVFWVVLVREHGYREPEHDNRDFIILGALTTGLLIFSVAASALILTKFRDHSVPETNGNGEEERREAENELIDESAASGSVYTALELCTSSIYTVLDQDMPNNDVKQRQTLNTGKEDGIFESVYENY